MSYQVIARKWRPQRFSDMVGQEHIARTLRNAVMSGRIAHAYLFVGPRGIGKTTSARIFAKALNCTNPQDGEPCCECESCKAIQEERSVDVIEFDAATHTGVDDARELCEDVLHLPISAKYKIYIIDEVHMLSKGAWNALLKTIEEPPAHAKFIFATTEVNKVLPTVISRCQRFDLRRIKARDIAQRLRLIADAEHVSISDSAIRVVAQAADGGMRDAQSLLDQLISFFGMEDGQQISEEQALNLFGLTAPADMKNLLTALLTNDRIAVITCLHNFAVQSKNLETLYEEITAWLRAILLCRILPDPHAVLEETQEKIAECMKLSKLAKTSSIQRLLENISASGYLLRNAINKQVFLEAILLKALRIAHAAQVEDLIARLNQIRKNGELDALNSVVPLYEIPPGEIITTADSSFAPKMSGRIQKTVVRIAPEPVKEPEPVPASEDVVSGDKKKIVEIKQEYIQPEPVKEAEPEPVKEAEPEPVKEAEPEPVKEAEPETGSVPVSEPEPEKITKSAPAPNTLEEEPVENNPVPETENGVVQPPDTEKFTAESLWQSMVIDARDLLKKNILAGFMQEATPVSWTHGRLVVAFDNMYEAMQQMMVEREHALLQRRLQALTENPRAVLFIEARPGLATEPQIRQMQNAQEMKQNIMQNQSVAEAVQAFGGRIADVHDLDASKDE